MNLLRHTVSGNGMNNALLEQNIIDLSSFTSSSELLQELSSIVEANNISDTRIKLVLGSIALTPAQVCSIKAVLETFNVEIELLCTNSVHTQLAALGASLAVSEQTPCYGIKAHEKPVITEETLDEEFDTKEFEIDKQYTTEKALEEAIAIESGSIAIPAKYETLYIKQTLRSGQTIHYEGNVVIIGDCHPGSEIVAEGDITAWGILSGIAHAGSKGNNRASIRALKINAIQLRISDLIARKPDRLIIEKIEKTSTFTPEEAKISEGEIIIYALNA